MKAEGGRKSAAARLQLWLALLTGATLLIGVASFALHLAFFPVQFHGWNEVTLDKRIAGWVVNRATPEQKFEVQLYINDAFVASRIADLLRPDVVAANETINQHCGYSFPVPSLARGRHEARVFVVHEVGTGAYRTLQLTGVPLCLAVEATGSVRACPADE